MTEIHPTAIVAPSAQLGEGVKIGPFALVGEGVRIGDRCEIEAHAQVRSGSILGAGCSIGSGALVGADPHHTGFDRRTPSRVRAGQGNIIREYATLHRSIYENGETILGDENYLMNGAHVGHDCVVGNHNILANNALLGGHVQLGNRCFLGGGSAFHQFVRIGDFVMAQGLAGASQDVFPFSMLAAGVNQLAGINRVGIRRAGFSEQDRGEIKEVFRTVSRSGLSLKHALAQLEGRDWGQAARLIIEFLSSSSQKGFCIRMRTGSDA